jgi:hypothetical protein
MSASIQGKPKGRTLATRVWGLHCGLGTLPSHRDPLLDLLGVGSCHDAQVSFSPETGGHDRRYRFGPSQAHARVFGQQIGTIASDFLQLGNCRGEVFDLSTCAVVATDASDPGRQELVGAAHPNSLEHVFDLPEGSAQTLVDFHKGGRSAPDPAANACSPSAACSGTDFQRGAASLAADRH